MSINPSVMPDHLEPEVLASLLEVDESAPYVSWQQLLATHPECKGTGVEMLAKEEALAEAQLQQWRH